MDTPTAAPQTVDPVADFDDALARAFAKVERAKADGLDQNIRKDGKARRYVTLASVDQAVREALTSEGFSFPQLATTSATEGGGLWLTITTQLRRRGVKIEATLGLPVLGAMRKGGEGFAPPTAQSVGSAMTYGRRYALSALLGVCPDEDDDVTEASKRPPEPKPDPLWDAYTAKRSAVAQALGLAVQAAHERIMDAAGIHHDGDPTDAEVRRMIDAADALLKPAPEPVQEPAAKSAKTTKEQAIAAANAAFREAYKAYVAEAREQGVKSEPWQTIAARGIEAEQWSTEKGSHTVADWMAALHEAERATRALQTGGGQ